MEIGRPTELTEELTLKIRAGILEGKQYKEIREELGINENTWDTWVYKNYQGFRETLQSWTFEINEKRRKRLLAKAENNLEVLLDSEDERVKADMTKFVAKTLGKDEGYTERTEMTGKDGKDLIPKPIMDLTDELQQNNSNKENISID